MFCLSEQTALAGRFGKGRRSMSRSFQTPGKGVEGPDLVGSRGCEVDRGQNLVAEREKVASAFVP